MRNWVVAAVIVAVLIAVYFRGTGSHGAGPQALVGRPAASFPVKDTAGRPGGLEQYRGKIVVLNLWASWCPPCREEMPDLQRLYASYEKRGVVVIGVDQGESPDRAASFARSLSIQYPIWIDDDQQYGRTYAALGLPTTFVVDRSGVVTYGHDGPLSYPEMTQAIAPLLIR